MSGLKNRRTLAVIAIGVMVLAAGCMDVSSTTVVSEDGEIEEMTIEMETLTAFHSMMEADAEEEGYESVEAMLEADFKDDLDDEDAVGSLDIEIEDLGEDDGHLFVITAEDIDPDAMDEVDITVEDDTVTYESTGGESDPLFDEDDFWGEDFGDEAYQELDDQEAQAVEYLIEEEPPEDDLFGDDMEFIEEALNELMSFEYVVEMPGEIHDHNADELSEGDTVATWTLDFSDTEAEDEEFYVESATDGPDPSPGFGAAVAVGVLLTAMVAVGLRRRH